MDELIVKEVKKLWLVESPKYDPEKDIRPVDPYGFINLRDAFVNGSVPTKVADEVANYNGIDDPESIVGTPKDIFEGYRMRDAILAAGKVSENGKLSGESGSVISAETK